MRKFAFENGKYYHVYNRGTDKRKIFLNHQYYIKFANNLARFNNNLTYAELKQSGCLDRTANIVTVVAYCFLPNHYHLLLRQEQNSGVSKFIKRVSQSYTQYFNKVNDRSGVLFQGQFKATEIKSESQLIKTSCYINGNPEIHGISSAFNWGWSSYQDFLNKNEDSIAKPHLVLKKVKDIDEYTRLTKHVIKQTKLERSGREDRTAYMKYE